MVLKDGDIPADVVVSLLEMSDALHKGSYSLQVGNGTVSIWYRYGNGTVVLW